MVTMVILGLLIVIAPGLAWLYLQVFCIENIIYTIKAVKKDSTFSKIISITLTFAYEIAMDAAATWAIWHMYTLALNG